MDKIKKDDLVAMIVGKDKDEQGKVISVNTKKNKVLVRDCNMATECTKQAPGRPQGSIVSRGAPIGVSSVMLIIDDKATGVGFEEKDGKRVRMAKATGRVIDQLRRGGKNVG